MPYDGAAMAGDGDEPMGPPPSPAGDGDQESSGEPREDTLFIHKSMLPEGMTANPGDILEFKVVGQDSKGDIEVEYNHGDNEKSAGDRLKDDFRAHMSKTGAPAGAGY